MVKVWLRRIYIWLTGGERWSGRDLDAWDLHLKVFAGLSLSGLLFVAAADNLGFEGLYILQTGVGEYKCLKRFVNALDWGAWSRHRCQSQLQNSLT